ncbi:MAG TPA: MarR family transcriptional regulator [Dermatophilaceae bacterium]|jgi:DNA-binding MarR family transcriptional regulator
MAISLESATRLSTELVRVMKLFQSMRQHAPKLHPGVEAASYPILFNLIEEPRRVSLLADCIHSDVSTVSRQVSMLASHGLLDKVADPLDGRAYMVSLSAEGKDLVERLKTGRGEWFREMLHDWEPAEVDAFNDQLDRFARSFEASRDQVRSIPFPPAMTLAPSGDTPLTTTKEP